MEIHRRIAKDGSLMHLEQHWQCFRGIAHTKMAQVDRHFLERRQCKEI